MLVSGISRCDRDLARSAKISVGREILKLEVYRALHIADKSYAVLDLRVVFIEVLVGNGETCREIEFVGRIDKPRAVFLLAPIAVCVYLLDNCGALLGTETFKMAESVAKTRKSRGHYRNTCQSRVERDKIVKRAIKLFAVVVALAEHYLTAERDIRICKHL